MQLVSSNLFLLFFTNVIDFYLNYRHKNKKFSLSFKYSSSITQSDFMGGIDYQININRLLAYATYKSGNSAR